MNLRCLLSGHDWHYGRLKFLDGCFVYFRCCIRCERTEDGVAASDGEAFLAAVREIAEGCSKLETPERAARVTAFSVCVLLDGSGEAYPDRGWRVVDRDGKPVDFFHHDLWR